MSSLSAYRLTWVSLTLDIGNLLPWTWGISSRLLQQSTAAAPYLGRGVAPLGHTHAPSQPQPIGCIYIQIYFKEFAHDCGGLANPESSEKATSWRPKL